MKVFQHLFSELVAQLPNIAMYCISQRNLAIQWKHVGIHVFKLSPTCCLLIFGIVGFHESTKRSTKPRTVVILSHQPTTYQLQYPVIMVPSLLQIMHIFWVALHGKNIEASTRASTGTNLSHGKNQVLRENQCRDSIAGRVELFGWHGVQLVGGSKLNGSWRRFGSKGKIGIGKQHGEIER